MINELIERTNKPEFYQNGRLHLTKLSGEIGDFKTMEFNFVLDEQDSYGNYENIEYWNITAHQTIEFKDIFVQHYMPYIKLKILTDHPLLWEYTKPRLECKLINFPKKPFEFIGELFSEYEKTTGNWIPLHKNFWAFDKYYKKNQERYISFAEPLKEPIKSICDKHGVEFVVRDTIDGFKKGYAHRPNAKILIFGNEDVSPNDFNLKQPYIIADEFIASKK